MSQSILAVPQQQPIEIKSVGTWKIRIPLSVYRELSHYVQGFDTECSGCGLVNVVKNGDEHTFFISKVYLPSEQINTAGSTDIEESAVGKLVTKLVNEGVDTELLRLHWHSHATMGVFHSATDEDNYKTLQTGSWLVSLVLNKKGDVLGRVDYYTPVRVIINHVPVEVMLEDSIEEKTWQENIDAAKKYAEEHKPKVVGFEKGRDADDDYGYPRHYGIGYTPNKVIMTTEERGTYALNMLEGVVSMLPVTPLEEPSVSWDTASIRVFDHELGLEYDIEMSIDRVEEPEQKGEQNEQPKNEIYPTDGFGQM